MWSNVSSSPQCWQLGSLTIIFFLQSRAFVRALRFLMRDKVDDCIPEARKILTCNVIDLKKENTEIGIETPPDYYTSTRTYSFHSLLPHRARDGPISIIYHDSLPSDEVENLVWLKTGISAVPSKLYVMFIVSLHTPFLRQIIFCPSYSSAGLDGYR